MPKIFFCKKKMEFRSQYIIFGKNKIWTWNFLILTKVLKRTKQHDFLSLYIGWNHTCRYSFLWSLFLISNHFVVDKYYNTLAASGSNN